MTRVAIDKGESELIAWLLEEDPEVPFVTCDRRAQRIAEQEKLVTWDVLDLVHEWLCLQVLAQSEAERCLLPWQDDPHSRWCPKDYVGLGPTLQMRYGRQYLQQLADRRT